jgi:predicted Fe-Mo cluster-binding NifX family protein
MRIAIATDQDTVASGFGCCPFVTIATVEDGRIRETLLIPNTGAGHVFWADLFFRNSIKFVVAGSMGPNARSTMLGRGIQPVLGASGPVEEVVRLFAGGGLRNGSPQPVDGDGACTATPWVRMPGQRC